MEDPNDSHDPHDKEVSASTVNRLCYRPAKTKNQTAQDTKGTIILQPTKGIPEDQLEAARRSL